MKCEKCGIDIVEGTLCDNCKNLPVTEDIVTQPVAPEVPQAYDPVADLMNEPVNGTVNLEKNEMESSIPLGDNLGIPEVPTNENVVFVAPQVEVPAEAVAVETTPVVENTNPAVTENPAEVSGEVQNVEAPVSVEKKKLSTGAIIGIIIAVVVLLGGGLLFYIRFSAVSDMMDTAKINTFVTEVQAIMDAASTGFMSEAMKPGNQGASVEFHSGSYPFIEFETEKAYKINLDRNGRFTGIIVYDENFCYSIPDEFGQEINKTMIKAENVLPHDKADNLNDGCHGVKNN